MFFNLKALGVFPGFPISYNLVCWKRLAEEWKGAKFGPLGKYWIYIVYFWQLHRGGFSEVIRCISDLSNTGQNVSFSTN